MDTHLSIDQIEPRLRWLLPPELHAAVWVEPSAATLTRVFEHLRTLQHVLNDYVPRAVSEDPPVPGKLRHVWLEGTLMFTDLAGFTPLLEANAARGRAGARSLLQVLNGYFAAMIEIISKFGGNLLEFTGDALLAQFPADHRGNDTARAIKAGLRMQRAMEQFLSITIGQDTFALGMRIGIHAGRFLAADLGTPRRMEHVLLGGAAHLTKQAEGAGQVGRVCLTERTRELVEDQFRFEDHKPGYVLVVDDLTEETLGQYDIALSRRRTSGRAMLFDRSVPGLVSEIDQALKLIEPLAAYLPPPVLNLLIQSAASRKIPPNFPEPTVVFVNLVGLPESIDYAQPGEEAMLVASFSHTFAFINAAVEARGGVLKNVTCHHTGSYMLIYFGAPNSHTDDPKRAASAALAIREVVSHLAPLVVGERRIEVSCQLGIARGPTFTAEIGEPRGRREFNILGDTVNTAARLMDRAVGNQILITEEVYQEIKADFHTENLGTIPLKGKAHPVPIFALVAASE